MSKSKVLLLGKLPPPYFGPAIATKILLESGLKDRFEMIYVSTKLNNSLSGLGGMSIDKPFRLLWIYLRLIWSLLVHKPALVVIPISQTRSGFSKDAPLIRISSFMGSKILLQLRGSDFRNWIDNETPRMKRWVEKQIQRAYGVVVLGNNLRYLFEPYFDANQIYVVPNGGNYTFPEKQVQSSRVQVLYFANLLETKGSFEVIQALAELSDIAHLFQCRMVGAWSQQSFKKRSLDFIAQNNIEVEIGEPEGERQKLESFVKADIFVFPPNSPEGHPWVIVEAMAAGLPIISTNQGAISESVIDGQNGFLVGNRAPKEIAEALRTLILDENLRKEMANRSRELYRKHFTENAMVENYTCVFNDIIAGK